VRVEYYDLGILGTKVLSLSLIYSVFHAINCQLILLYFVVIFQAGNKNGSAENSSGKAQLCAGTQQACLRGLCHAHISLSFSFCLYFPSDHIMRY
jgi:hypothetical protein